jgi:hypothetical protein
MGRTSGPPAGICTDCPRMHPDRPMPRLNGFISVPKRTAMRAHAQLGGSEVAWTEQCAPATTMREVGLSRRSLGVKQLGSESCDPRVKKIKYRGSSWTIQVNQWPDGRRIADDSLTAAHTLGPRSALSEAPGGYADDTHCLPPSSPRRDIRCACDMRPGTGIIGDDAARHSSGSDRKGDSTDETKKRCGWSGMDER